MRNIVSLLLLIVVVVQICGARDTTFISGEVSGVWSIDGSPYVILDSVWVESGFTLSISEGVDVIFIDEAHFDCRCEVLWIPDEKIVSGVYLVRAKMKNGNSLTKRVVYFK